MRDMVLSVTAEFLRYRALAEQAMAQVSDEALSAGEVPQYTDVVSKARQQAVERLMEHAASLGANAVVGVRFDSSEMGEDGSMAEIIAYGTGVVVAPA